MPRTEELPDAPSAPIKGKPWSNPKRVRLFLNSIENVIKRDVLLANYTEHIYINQDVIWISPEASQKTMTFYYREAVWLSNLQVLCNQKEK